MSRKNKPEDLWKKVNKTDDCWIWQGYINKTWGYGYMMVDGVLWRVHRLAYTLIKGKIPNGKHLDHLCKNRACVNPEHLEPVTNKENVLRGDGVTAVNARKTQCLRGHGLSGSNLYITPSGYRNCKKCRNFTTLRWSHARKVTQA